MSTATFLLIYTTLPNADTAQAIARHLVGEGLAACTNLLPGMRSCYRWQGEICEDDEVVLIIKVPATGAAAVRARLLELHPYNLPCVLELPISGGHAPYLAWLSAYGQADA